MYILTYVHTKVLTYENDFFLYHLPNCDEVQTPQLSQKTTNQPAGALLVSPHPPRTAVLLWRFGLFLTWRWSRTSFSITVINTITVPQVCVI